MRKTHNNSGFTLVELLISMALLSIIMLMVVQFMSTTTGASKRTKQNLKVQTTSNELTGNINDTLSAATYIRVSPADATVYVKDTDMKKDVSRTKPMVDVKTVTETGYSTIDLAYNKKTFTFDLVPDDYGNYVQSQENLNMEILKYKDTPTGERKVIVDMQDFRLMGRAKNTYYPLANDLESAKDVRSFRCMKKIVDNSEVFLYTKPKYIYVEYNNRTGDNGMAGDSYVPTDDIMYAIYLFNYLDSEDKCEVYLYRGEWTGGKYTKNRFNTAVANVDALVGKTGTDGKKTYEGLLTDDLKDLYLTCDAENNAFTIDALFDINGYMHNGISPVSLRNSNTLTARPYNSYKSNEETQNESSYNDAHKDDTETEPSGGAGEETPEEEP